MKSEQEIIDEVRALDGVMIHVRYHIDGKVVKSAWSGTVLNSVVLPPDILNVAPPISWYEQVRKERERAIAEAFAKGTRLYNVEHRMESYEFAVPMSAEEVSARIDNDRPSVHVKIKGDWVEIEPVKISPVILMAAGA